MMNPYPSPRRISSSSGGGSSGPAPVTAYILRYGDADHLKFAESTTMTFADFVAAIVAPKPTVHLRQISLDTLAIPGSGQGAVGSNAYGGMSGPVIRKQFWLSELLDGDTIREGDVYVDVGAGGSDPDGVDGIDGSATSITFSFYDGDTITVYAPGGRGGRLTAEDHRQAWARSVGHGVIYADPTLSTYAGTDSPFGPGTGGNYIGGGPAEGGTSSAADIDNRTSGQSLTGAPGDDAPPQRFLKFGGSSASNDAGSAGRGGNPGGASGATAPGYPPGPGGNGEVRIQTTIWETL